MIWKGRKAGVPVCTRDGKKVRIICFDAKSLYPILALVSANDSCENFAEYTINGRYYEEGEQDDRDLMMASVKKEGWVNVYGEYIGEIIYTTEEEAKSRGRQVSNYIATCKIEWEE